MKEKIDKIQDLLIVPSVDEQPKMAINQMKILNLLVELKAEVEQLTMPDVIKSLPSDEEVKTHIDILPYYGTCTTEYKEGFEDGVKWLKVLINEGNKKL